VLEAGDRVLRRGYWAVDVRLSGARSTAPVTPA